MASHVPLSAEDVQENIQNLVAQQAQAQAQQVRDDEEKSPIGAMGNYANLPLAAPAAAPIASSSKLKPNPRNWKPPIGPGDRVDQEEAPKTDVARIGMELAGVGKLHVTAKTGFEKQTGRYFPQPHDHLLKMRIPDPAPKKNATKEERAIAQQEQQQRQYARKEDFKRQRLYVPETGGYSVHSEPQNDGPGDTTAELVVEPPFRRDTGIPKLIKTVDRAMGVDHGSERSLTNAGTRAGEGDVETQWVNGPQAEKWRDRARPAALASLQTTIGVSAQALMHDKREERHKVVSYLVGHPDQQEAVHGHLQTAVDVEQHLYGDGAGEKRDPKDVTEARARARLAIAMSLIHAHVEQDKVCVAGSKDALLKDTYGLNIKGYSGLEGLGIAERSPEHGALTSLKQPEKRAAVLTHLANRQRGSLSDNQRETINGALSRVGDPGLSVQVAHERGPALPTFLEEGTGKLHTVIESREGKKGKPGEAGKAVSPLNKDMGTLINEERGMEGLKDEAAAAMERIKRGRF